MGWPPWSSHDLAHWNEAKYLLLRTQYRGGNAQALQTPTLEVIQPGKPPQTPSHCQPRIVAKRLRVLPSKAVALVGEVPCGVASLGVPAVQFCDAALGATWVDHLPLPQGSAGDCAQGGSIFALCVLTSGRLRVLGTTGNDSSPLVVWSHDGINWQSKQLGVHAESVAHAVCGADGRVWRVEGGQLFTSSDLSTWQQVPQPDGLVIMRLYAWKAQLWVVAKRSDDPRWVWLRDRN